MQISLTGEVKILVVVLKLGLKHSQKRGQWWLRWLYQILDIVGSFTLWLEVWFMEYKTKWVEYFHINNNYFLPC